MKLDGKSLPVSDDMSFSALGRAVWDETNVTRRNAQIGHDLSVLSVEPYGMKQWPIRKFLIIFIAFSALGRAVWDETTGAIRRGAGGPAFQCSRSSRMG